MAIQNLPELDLWRLWKLATETVRARILDEISSSCGLSEAELAVLFRVAENASHQMRQCDLAASMRWHRSRLSHQLTRMEQRGLVQRKHTTGGVAVALTRLGDRSFASAQPIFVSAIRKHFKELVLPEHEASFRAVLERLVNGGL